MIRRDETPGRSPSGPRRSPTASRNRSAILLGAAVVALGAGGAIWLGARGGSPAPRAAVGPAATRGADARRTRIPVREGEAALDALPRPTGSGRILFATTGCRLGELDLALGRVAALRPDLRVCDATAAPAPALAVGDVEAGGGPTLRWIGPTASTDRTVFSAFARIRRRTVSHAGDVAACLGQGGGSAGVTFAASRGGPPRAYRGCQAAWWGGSLVRLGARGTIVTARGRTVFRPPGPGGASTALLATSRDEGTLGVLGRRGGGWRLAILGPSRVPRPIVSAGWIGDARPAALRISPDGRLYAVEDGRGRWTVARADGRTPPASSAGSLPLLDVAFAPDSSAVAVATGTRLVLLDPDLLAPVASSPQAAGSVDWMR